MGALVLIFHHGPLCAFLLGSFLFCFHLLIGNGVQEVEKKWLAKEQEEDKKETGTIVITSEDKDEEEQDYQIQKAKDHQQKENAAAEEEAATVQSPAVSNSSQFSLHLSIRTPLVHQRLLSKCTMGMSVAPLHCPPLCITTAHHCTTTTHHHHAPLCTTTTHHHHTPLCTTTTTHHHHTPPLHTTTTAHHHHAPPQACPEEMASILEKGKEKETSAKGVAAPKGSLRIQWAV
jgi:hypothetical protein